MSNDKAVLTQILGKLLGFEDGASDVLEHLLTIESKDDLSEYLTQLLGDGATSEISEFVDNVGHYNRGEPLTFSASNEGSNARLPEKDSKPPSAPKQSLKPAPAPSNQSSKTAAVDSRKQNKKSSRVPPPKIKQHAQKPVYEKTQTQSEGLVGDKPAFEGSSSKGSPEKSKTVEKLRPTRGEARTVCGCYGTYHKPLTNCLYCGRISCTEEGYDFCPFCGYLVDDVSDDQDHSHDPSWLQKERLLRFDREFARRTEVFDDQADYQGPTTWMTEDERMKKEENEERQLEALKRPKQTLNLVL